MSDKIEIERLQGVIKKIDTTLSNIVGGIHHQVISEARKIAQQGLDPDSVVEEGAATTMPPSGRLCKTCNVEMFYNNPSVVLTSYPPQMSVQCPECKKINYIRI